ncbi:MAG TPA: prolyl oligopeptidase family serine peptidase [Bryobacteraceae bacterium]|nr:prolyl oligopeptidase family serine peptidase [Bryobacteraceae bacterium]
MSGDDHDRQWLSTLAPRVRFESMKVTKKRLAFLLGGISLLIPIVSFSAAALLAEGALHPLIRRRASDTATLAYSIAQTANVTATRICIRADDGNELTAWWLSPKVTNRRAVMACHGVADSAFGAMGYALLFLRNGYSVLVPNGRGQGDSQGYVAYGVLEAHDTVRWLEWLKGRGVTAAFGFGESLGGSVLIESLAQGADFRAIVAECPYSSFEAVAEERLAQHVPSAVAIELVKEGVLYTRLRYGVDLGNARPDVAIRYAHVPILLIHGLADDETLPQNSERLLRANPKEVQLWLVPGAKHTGAYARAPRQFERRVLQWFAQAQGSSN